MEFLLLPSKAVPAHLRKYSVIVSFVEEFAAAERQLRSCSVLIISFSKLQFVSFLKEHVAAEGQLCLCRALVFSLSKLQ